MKNRVRKLLMSLGIDPALLGYDYLIESIVVSFEDKTYLNQITKKLYPHLAKQFQTTSSRAEKAIRHAIERASFRRPDMHDVLIICPSAESGKYTNSQFISACVELLKMEDENENL